MFNFECRKAWGKGREICNGQDEEEVLAAPEELLQKVQQNLSAGIAHAPTVPATLPVVDERIVIDIGGHGCKRCENTTHMCSNHNDCPYNKQNTLLLFCNFLYCSLHCKYICHCDIIIIVIYSIYIISMHN